MQCNQWKRNREGQERRCGLEARCTVALPGKEPTPLCYECGRSLALLATQQRLHVTVDELPTPLEPRAA